jgi:ABC-type uncharacterized transport system permease subunit
MTVPVLFAFLLLFRVLDCITVHLRSVFQLDQQILSISLLSKVVKLERSAIICVTRLEDNT